MPVFDTVEVKDDLVRDLSNCELAERMAAHVMNRSGPRIDNGAWIMMLEAAKRLRGETDALQT